MASLTAMQSFGTWLHARIDTSIDRTEPGPVLIVHDVDDGDSLALRPIVEELVGQRCVSQVVVSGPSRAHGSGGVLAGTHASVSVHGHDWLLHHSSAQPHLNAGLACLFLLGEDRPGSSNAARHGHHALISAAVGACRPGAQILLLQHDAAGTTGLAALRTQARQAVMRLDAVQGVSSRAPRASRRAEDRPGLVDLAGIVAQAVGTSREFVQVSRYRLDTVLPLIPPSHHGHGHGDAGSAGPALRTRAGVQPRPVPGPYEVEYSPMVTHGGHADMEADVQALGQALCMDLGQLHDRDPGACADLRRLMHAQNLYNVTPARPKRAGNRKSAKSPRSAVLDEVGSPMDIEEDAVPSGVTSRRGPGQSEAALARPERVVLHMPLQITSLDVPVQGAASMQGGAMGVDTGLANLPRFVRLGPNLPSSALTSPRGASLRPSVAGTLPLNRHGGAPGEADPWFVGDIGSGSAAAAGEDVPHPPGHFFNRGLAAWQELRTAWRYRPPGWTRPRRGKMRHRAASDPGPGSGAGPGAGWLEWWMGFDDEDGDGSPRRSAGHDGQWDGETGGAEEDQDDYDEGYDDDDDEVDFEDVVAALVADGPGGIEAAPPLPRPIRLSEVIDLFEDSWDNTWLDQEAEEEEGSGPDLGWG